MDDVTKNVRVPATIRFGSEYRMGTDIAAAKADSKARVSIGTPEGVR